MELICLSVKSALVSLILANSECNVCSSYSYLYLTYTSIGNVTAIEFLHSLKTQCKTSFLIKYTSNFQISKNNYKAPAVTCVESVFVLNLNLLAGNGNSHSQTSVSACFNFSIDKVHTFNNRFTTNSYCS